MKKMIAFCGGDSQTGTTMTAQSVAEYLGKKGRKVLFVCAGTHPGNDYLGRKNTLSVDDLRHELAEGALTPGELEECLLHCRYMDVLPAVRSCGSGNCYSESAVSLIRRAAEEKYEWMIADCDCGGEGLPYSALKALGSSDYIFFVITQQTKCMSRLKGREGYFASFSNVPFCYVVNKFHDNGMFPDMEQMDAQLDGHREKLFRIDYVPFGWQAEAEGETLMQVKRFAAGIRNIAEYIDRGGEERNFAGRFRKRQRV